LSRTLAITLLCRLFLPLLGILAPVALIAYFVTPLWLAAIALFLYFGMLAIQHHLYRRRCLRRVKRWAESKSLRIIDNGFHFPFIDNYGDIGDPLTYTAIDLAGSKRFVSVTIYSYAFGWYMKTVFADDLVIGESES